MIPTWEDAENGESALDRFVFEHEPMAHDKLWRRDLGALLVETRIKEKERVCAIFQEYLQFIPQNHLKDLKELL